MKQYRVYERRELPSWQKREPVNEWIGVVEAKNEASALNKARKQFKVERSGGEYGAYCRRRNPEDIVVKERW